MDDSIQLGDLLVAMKRKDVKNVHLSVHPPDGRVTLVVPRATRMDVARAYAASKIGWIRAQQAKLSSQARETPRSFLTRESHYLWGKRYLLSVVERDAKPQVTLDHRRITLCVRPGGSRKKRAEIMHEWHKSLLHEAIPRLIAKWEAKAGVQVERYFLQRMKTKWGGCNARARTIRLNTELVKKPKDLLDYVVAHEVFHLVEPTHSERFVALLDRHYPSWREARAELNELPLAAEEWTSSAFG
jgi:predicted metal-dependent hydrolase